MKEATSELNMTVVVVVLIGSLSAFFFGVLWPRLNGNLHSKTKCSDAVCPPACVTNGKEKECHPNWADPKHQTIKCTYKDRGNDVEIVCPYKG